MRRIVTVRNALLISVVSLALHMCRSAGISPMACTLGKHSTIELHRRRLPSILLSLSALLISFPLQTVQGAAKPVRDVSERVYDQKIVLQK